MPAQAIALAPRPDGREPLFVAALEYLLKQNQQVEPLYQLEKAGKLGHGEQPMTDEARSFIEARLLEGGQMLGNIWLTAYKSAVPDTFLRAALIKRATAGQAGAATSAAAPTAEKKAP